MAGSTFYEDILSPGTMDYWGAEPVPVREGDVEIYDALVGAEHVDDRTPAEILTHMAEAGGLAVKGAA